MVSNRQNGYIPTMVPDLEWSM